MHDNTLPFNANAELIGVYNRESGCMSHCIDDFEGPVQQTNHLMKGFSGTKTWNVSKGTIVWKWQDDQGQELKFIIPILTVCQQAK